MADGRQYANRRAITATQDGCSVPAFDQTTHRTVGPSHGWNPGESFVSGVFGAGLGVLRITVEGVQGPRMSDMAAFKETINMAHFHELGLVIISTRLARSLWLDRTCVLFDFKIFQLRQYELPEPYSRVHNAVDLLLACLQYGGANLETLDISLYMERWFTLLPITPLISLSLQQIALFFSSIEEIAMDSFLELLLVCLPSGCIVSATEDS